MNLSSPFIRRPVATTLIASAFLLVGIVGYVNLPVAALPNVDFPTVQVSVALPRGESRDDGLKRRHARSNASSSLIPGISQMTSVSSLGSTSITLQFELTQSINVDFEQIQAAITAGQRLSCPAISRAHPPCAKSIRPMRQS